MVGATEVGAAGAGAGRLAWWPVCVCVLCMFVCVCV